MPLSGEQHYQNFLARISTREAFRKEIQGKLEASQYFHGLTDSQISELVSILPMDTMGDPQFWPPVEEVELPEWDNGYRVVGKCVCGELLTTVLGGSVSNPRHYQLRHNQTYLRQCADDTGVATIATHRVGP